MTPQIFKQFTGTIDEFKTWVKTGSNAQDLGNAIVFIHEEPQYFNGGTTFDDTSSFEGAIYANGYFYKASDVEGYELTAEKIAELVSGKSGVSVTIDEQSDPHKLIFTPVLVNELTVTGVTVGGVSDGKTFAAGTSIEEVLTAILKKEIDVTATLPTISFTALSPSPIAIGTTQEYTPIEITYTDGSFNGQEGYTYSIAAECPEDATSVQFESSSTSAVVTTVFDADGNFEKATVVYKPSTEGTVTIKASEAYKASTGKPVTNLDNPSAVSIAAGTATATRDIASYYQVYYWVNTTTDLTAVTTGSEFTPANYSFTSKLLSSNVSVLGSTAQAIGSDAATGYVYVLIPTTKAAPNFQNSLGIEGTMNLIATNLTLTNASGDDMYSNGNVAVKYALYYFQAQGSEYKNCVIKK